MAIFRINPVHVAFAIADDQIAIIQHRRGQQTVQQIALRPQGYTAVGGQCQQAIVLVNQVDTVTIDNYLIAEKLKKSLRIGLITDIIILMTKIL